MEKEIVSIPQAILEEVAQECMCTLIRKTARLMTQWYDANLQPGQLHLTQCSMLVAIALAQEVPLTRLAEIMVLDRTTLARNLKPLENQGLIKVEAGEDRRVRLVRLTEDGREALRQTYPYWKQAQETVKARLGQTQWDVLRGSLLNLETQMLAGTENLEPQPSE